MRLPFLPAEGTKLAGQVDQLYLGLLLISAFYMSIIFLPILFFLFKYRRGHRANRSPVKIPTWRVEIVWTTIPFLMMMGLFSWGAALYYRMERIPAGSVQAVVVAKQWMWKIQHEEGNREINELHVPLGETVRLTMTSEDVIHSFYVPAFRLKQDVMPGRYASEWFKPIKAGTYHLFCAELCGADHSEMGGSIIVMEPAQYQLWLNTSRPPATMAASGERLFRELGCSGCHMSSTVIRAPRLEGVYGKPVPLQGGQIVTADDQYIRDSILLPASQIAAGYSNVMPSYAGRLSEDDLFQLVEYIRSLGNESPPPESR